jgi:hypothetical protein
MHYVPTRVNEYLLSGFKAIYRFFIPKASNAFRSFLPYSKLALVSMATTVFMSFLPYNKLYAMLTVITSAEDCV